MTVTVTLTPACQPWQGAARAFCPRDAGTLRTLTAREGRTTLSSSAGGDAGAQTAVRGRARGAQGPDGGRARPGRLSRGPPTPPHGCLCSAESVKGQRAPGPGGDPGTLSFTGGCARMETRACRWRGEWPAPLGKRAPFGKKCQSRTPFLLFGVGRLRSQKLPGAGRSREASVSAVGGAGRAAPGLPGGQEGQLEPQAHGGRGTVRTARLAHIRGGTLPRPRQGSGEPPCAGPGSQQVCRGTLLVVGENRRPPAVSAGKGRPWQTAAWTWTMRGAQGTPGPGTCLPWPR